MKRIIFILTLVVVFTASAMAQRGDASDRKMDPKKREVILNAKMKHLQEKLMLSPEQTEKVMPIYRDYMDEIAALPLLKREAKNPEMATSDQAYTFVKNGLDRKKTILVLQEKCILKLKDILNPQQLVSFLRVEHDIQKQIMRERKMRGTSHKHGRPNLESREGKKK